MRDPRTSGASAWPPPASRGRLVLRSGLPTRWPVSEEAWWVDRRDKRDAGRVLGLRIYTDRSRIAIVPRSCGLAKAVGTVKFFCLDRTVAASHGVGTGDLGSEGVNPNNPRSPWRIHRIYGEGLCRTTPGPLPSVGARPAWWNRKPVEGSSVRFRSAVWNCCLVLGLGAAQILGSPVLHPRLFPLRAY